LDDLAVRGDRTEAVRVTDPQAWNPQFELTVTAELARPGGMAKRPYVAIWIEDADRRPVRTIALP
jgi:hypothetical protein